MFADLLRKHFAQFNAFIGHIGGDDFFVGIADHDIDSIHYEAGNLLAGFKASAASLYGQEHRSAGYVSGIDRRGKPANFPLLSCSGALVAIERASKERAEYPILSLIAALKKESKKTGNTISAACLM